MRIRRNWKEQIKLYSSGSSSSSSSNIEYSIVFCLDDHYRNDDGVVKQKMELQNNKVMQQLTMPEI